MNLTYNPFKPGTIVHAGMFAGRMEELEALERGLFQTKNGNPAHFLLHGERGIGKSSLIVYLDALADGKISSPDDRQYNFLTLNVVLERTTTGITLLEKIGTELTRSLLRRGDAKTKLVSLWDFFKNWEGGGFKYNSNTGPSLAAESLAETIADVSRRLASDIDGVVIFIDEADKPGDEANLGEFLKVFTERLTRAGGDRVCIGLAGVTGVVDMLRRSHESSVRILHTYLLEPLATDERIAAVRLGLEEAALKNQKETRIEADAMEWICRYSEGFPHFIQQYAFSAFETDSDDVIDINDVHVCAFKENGALDQLGVRYFEEMYRAQINSDDYRSVLQAMAEHPEKYMARKEIKEATGLKVTTLTNALQALKARQIILPHPDKQGLYRLPSDSFAVWIRAQIKRSQGGSPMKEF